MTALIIISAIAFVLSIGAIRSAWQMSPIAESGHIASIILAGGLLGFLVSFGGFIFICGMLAAGARP